MVLLFSRKYWYSLFDLDEFTQLNEKFIKARRDYESLLEASMAHPAQSQYAHPAQPQYGYPGAAPVGYPPQVDQRYPSSQPQGWYNISYAV